MKKASKSKSKRWTKAEDSLLFFIVDNIGGKWKFISRYFPNKTIFQIHNRYISINPNISKGKFSMEEDKKVMELINSHGKNWTKLSIIMKNRTSKQIRSRYINYLCKNYDESSEISAEEKKIIFENYPILGNKWREYTILLEKNRSPSFIRKVLFKN
jgi:myb proto-oncogene protein